MAENNAVLKRRKNVSKDTIMAAASVYQSLFGNTDGSVPATFQVVYFIAWTPHESQPKVRE
jgi:NADH dehydrogenase [ubiquinone] 1 alpha subcomplex assembly factor 5